MNTGNPDLHHQYSPLERHSQPEKQVVNHDQPGLILRETEGAQPEVILAKPDKPARKTSRLRWIIIGCVLLVCSYYTSYLNYNWSEPVALGVDAVSGSSLTSCAYIAYQPVGMPVRLLEAGL